MPDQTETPLDAQALWDAHAEPAPLPDWFDAEKHQAGTGGIVEIETGVPLADDGLPVHPALRAQREDAPPAETTTRRRGSKSADEAQGE